MCGLHNRFLVFFFFFMRVCLCVKKISIWMTARPPSSGRTLLYAGLLCSTGVGLWNVYLLVRQLRANRAPLAGGEPVVLPPELEPLTTPDVFVRSLEFSQAKCTFSIISGVKEAVETSVALLGGLLPRLYNAVGSFMKWKPVAKLLGASKAVAAASDHGGFIHSCLFFLATDLISTALEMPVSYYYHFVLQARHNFNKMTVKEWLKDEAKSMFLKGVVLNPIILAMVNYVVRRFGWKFPKYLFTGSTVCALVATYLIPVLVMPLFNTFTPLPEGDLRSKIEALAKSLHFPLKSIKVMDGSRRSAHSNAFFYGLWKNKQIVLFDTLLDALTHEQVVGVLSHELGHWWKSHSKIRLAMAISQLYALCYASRYLMFSERLVSDFGFDSTSASPAVRWMLSMFFFVPLFELSGWCISAVSRSHEFGADAFAVELGVGADLREALIKMHKDSLVSPCNDWMYSACTHSHPPLPERIAAIDKKLRQRKEQEAKK